MTLRSLWEVSGTTGHFDAEGNFVPAQRYGVAKSLFLNIVVLPVVTVYLAGYMLAASFR
jgi:hypothetical protein